MPLFETLLTHTGVYCAEVTFDFMARKIAEKRRQSEFLCYDTQYLTDCYRYEPGCIGNNLPYVELVRFLSQDWTEFQQASANISVVKIRKPFELAKGPPDQLSDFQAFALAEFKKEKKIDRDDSVLRLNSYDPEKKLLEVQRCLYSEGLRSNYAMDLKGHIKYGTADQSLRSIFQTQYGRELPPLSDARLSNAVGIAVIVFYKDDRGNIVPYLPRRARPSFLNELIGVTRQSAVFSGGGFHCTASGETMWRDVDSSFEDIFTKDICRELTEEVGLTEQDLAWIHPVSLCREFLRGGKPQLFFVGFTRLSPREINKRRILAIEAQISRGRQEIENEELIIDTWEQLYSALWVDGTIEAVANMTYAQDCAVVAHKAKQFK